MRVTEDRLGVAHPLMLDVRAMCHPGSFAPPSNRSFQHPVPLAQLGPVLCFAVQCSSAKFSPVQEYFSLVLAYPVLRCEVQRSAVWCCAFFLAPDSENECDGSWLCRFAHSVYCKFSIFDVLHALTSRRWSRCEEAHPLFAFLLLWLSVVHQRILGGKPSSPLSLQPFVVTREVVRVDVEEAFDVTVLQGLRCTQGVIPWYSWISRS